MKAGICRFCQEPLSRSFADLGMSPLSNAIIAQDRLGRMEPFFPLHAYVCEECLLVQLEEVESPEAIFSDYSYFSSYSESWLRHCQAYTATMIERFGYGPSSLVVEIASNDGYLLQYFKEEGVPVLGVEPAANVAAVAEQNGVPTLVKFFGEETAGQMTKEGRQADLLIGNNVLAHVPALNDFVKGLKILLKPEGIITMEFPHLQRLIEFNQFDTIYHEHFSYFSFLTVTRIFSSHGLELFDVEEMPTHGGSLRIYGKHREDASKETSPRVEALLQQERAQGLHRLEIYSDFHVKVMESKRKLLAFLIQAKGEEKRIVGYGAPAKGNTLLNYCGIRSDFLDYTVDLSPHKQGHLLPGTHIPIHHPERVRETKPDYLLILPWNLKDEITAQMAFIREWGGHFVLPIPEVQVMP